MGPLHILNNDTLVPVEAAGWEPVEPGVCTQPWAADAEAPHNLAWAAREPPFRPPVSSPPAGDAAPASRQPG